MNSFVLGLYRKPKTLAKQLETTITDFHIAPPPLRACFVADYRWFSGSSVVPYVAQRIDQIVLSWLRARCFSLTKIFFYTAISLAVHAGLLTVADWWMQPDGLGPNNVHSLDIYLSSRSTAGSAETRPVSLRTMPGPEQAETSRHLGDLGKHSPGQPVSLSYLPASALDERPTEIRFFDFSSLPLPPDARGKLVIQLWINETGAIDFLEIEESNVPDEMSKQMLEQWRSLQFIAGMKDGVRVKSVVRYELTLAPEVLQKSAHTAKIIIP